MKRINIWWKARPIFFWIQILVIYVPILPVLQVDSVTSACYLNSIQFKFLKKKYDSDKNHYKYKVERRITFYPILDLKTESCSKKNLYSNRMEYALGRKDSNLRITGPKPGALPLGHAPFQFLFEINKE